MKHLKVEYLPEDEKYIKMIYNIAHQYGENSRCSFEDYVNVGLMALHKAKETFDPSKEAQFQTHAHTIIQRDILKEWQNNANELSCSPYHIKNTDGAKEDVDFQNATRISMYHKNSDGESTVHNHISASGFGSTARSVPSGSLSPLESAERDEIITKVDEILEDLDHEDKDIIIRRMFYGETFQYIAEVKGMSWRAVNYRFHNIKDALADKFTDAGLDIYA